MKKKITKSLKGGEILQTETVVQCYISKGSHELHIKRNEACEFDIKYQNFSIFMSFH